MATSLSGHEDGYVSEIDISLVAIIGFVLTIPLAARIPVNEELIVPGQLNLGPAVVSVGDLYLLFLVILATLIHRKVVIPLSHTLIYMMMFIITASVSAVVNGFGIGAVAEILQWVEMGVLVGFVGIAVSQEWHRQRIIHSLVLIGVIKGLWTLAYYARLGFPGRRFDALIEGASLVLLIGLIAADQWSWQRGAALVPLLATVLIAEERKVWIAILGASIIIAAGYLLAYKRRDVVLRFLASTTIVGLLLIPIVLLVFPEGIVARIETLTALLPGVGKTASFERAYIFETGLRMFINNPLLGVGPENWFSAKEIYATPELAEYERSHNTDFGQHSLFLKTLTEIGTIGFGFFMLLILQPVRMFGWYIKSKGNQILLLPLFALFVYILAVSFVRSGGFLIRSYLFLLLGIYLSYEVYGGSETVT